ncbi:MAG: OsmC family protein [Sphaerotilus natans]
MTPEELRQRQAPIKERYRAEPAAARQTFRAEALLYPDRALVPHRDPLRRLRRRLHPAAGGGGGEACSGDLMLESIAACAGVTLNVVATATGVVMRTARVVVEAESDFRGTLGLARDVPVGLTALRLRFEVDSDASDEQLATLLKLAERYCVIVQTLKAPPPVEVALRRLDPA